LGYPIINALEIIGSDSCTSAELRKCFDFMLKVGITPNISHVFGLEDFSKAQTLLESKGATGRIVLKCDDFDW